jgi:predicted naringenin-chalcone synthase
MGCQAAIQGLRVSDAICRSEPEAVVLLVCAELCTLHFDLTSQDPESLVVASLFGDGAGAALLSRRFLAVRPLCCIVDFASERVPGSEALLTWRLGEPAFQMGLSRSLPDVVGRHIGSFAQRLRPRAAAASRTGWAAHPGGRAILDAVQAGLGLEGEALSASRRTLADHGNMSSATLLFVLDQVVPRHPAGVALALGPGLSLEGLRWVRSP